MLLLNCMCRKWFDNRRQSSRAPKRKRKCRNCGHVQCVCEVAPRKSLALAVKRRKPRGTRVQSGRAAASSSGTHAASYIGSDTESHHSLDSSGDDADEAAGGGKRPRHIAAVRSSAPRDETSQTSTTSTAAVVELAPAAEASGRIDGSVFSTWLRSSLDGSTMAMRAMLEQVKTECV